MKLLIRFRMKLEANLKRATYRILIMLQSIILSASDVEELKENASFVSNLYNLQKEDLLSKMRLFFSIFKSTNNEKLQLNNRLKYFRVKNLQNVLAITALVFQLFLIVPMSLASCEGSFSCRRRLNNYLRKKMEYERLSSLAVLAIEKDIPLDYGDIVTKLSLLRGTGNRRLRFQ